MNRREFLKISAVTAAGASFGLHAAIWANPNPAPGNSIDARIRTGKGDRYVRVPCRIRERTHDSISYEAVSNIVIDAKEDFTFWGMDIRSPLTGEWVDAPCSSAFVREGTMLTLMFDQDIYRHGFA